MLPSLVRIVDLQCEPNLTDICFFSGTFPHFAARWVDPAFGFAVGWVSL